MSGVTPDAPVEVTAASGRYAVHVGAGILGSLGERMKAAGVGGRAALISDEHVFHRWGERALASLQGAGYAPHALRIPPGEGSKTLAGAETLFAGLIENAFTRHDVVVALGGGVVGDLAGFVAATYHRGMALVQVPTTLLAQVDSSIGGKVAVDHRLGKNLIGAFHPPRLVVADVKTLETLPERERWSGMAEVVKAALIQDAAFLALLEEQLESLIGGGAGDDARVAMVRRAAAIKAKVVSEDEHETGARMWLNFGHTFGHALETVSGYGPITHGEAVVHGMRVALDLSVKLGKLSAADAERAMRILARFPPPPVWPRVDPQEIHAALFRDKKVRAGQLRFVTLEALGKAGIEPRLGPELIEDGARRIARPS